MSYDYEFTVDGDTLTGTATGGPRGKKHRPVEVKEGKIRGDEVSFVEMARIMGMDITIR